MDNIYLEQGEWKFWVIFPVINRERIENSTTVPLDRLTLADRIDRGDEGIKRRR